MISASRSVESRSLVQVAHYPPGSSFGPRPLRDFEFVWVLRGRARLRVTGPDPDAEGDTVRDLELRPGTLALARPGTTDYYRWDDEHPSSHAYVHFDAGDPLATAARGWPLTRPFAGHDPLAALCGYLLDLAAAGGAAHRTRSDEVIGILLDLFGTGPFPHADAGPSLPPTLQPAVDHVRRVWRSEGVRRVPLSELAGAAGVSSGHLSRTFNEAFGCGPATALDLIRLARAATTLQRSNLTISEVAAHHGFADAYHLSKRFTAVYQSPPGRFRRGGETDPTHPLAARGLLTLWATLTDLPHPRQGA